MKIIATIIISLLIAPICLILVLLVCEWRPLPNERSVYDQVTQREQLPDTLKLISWNIGYAGLGADMDFFYDGGTKTRCSKEQSDKNLGEIISQLQTFDDVDFILLQEVDFFSKRSYRVDQFEMIRSALDYPYSGVALNYSSPFVPIPLSDPMGGVKSGLVTLSRHPILESIRRQYPSHVGLPNRLFDLKRSMLSVGILSNSNDTLWINNTHNSAFAQEEMRREEIRYIDSVICANQRSITAGDWNSTPPEFTPSKEALENKFFAPIPLSQRDLLGCADIIFDKNRSTVRYLDFPYEADKSITTIVDFAVSGRMCTIIGSETIDLGFVNSDHNPIIVTFIVE